MEIFPPESIFIHCYAPFLSFSCAFLTFNTVMFTRSRSPMIWAIALYNRYMSIPVFAVLHSCILSPLLSLCNAGCPLWLRFHIFFLQVSYQSDPCLCKSDFHGWQHRSYRLISSSFQFYLIYFSIFPSYTVLTGPRQG